MHLVLALLTALAASPAHAEAPTPAPLSLQDGAGYSAQLQRKQLSWDGVGQVRQGKAGAITTRRFALLVEDGATAASIEDVKKALKPGTVILVGGGYLTIGGVGLVGAGFAVALVEVITCWVGNSCAGLGVRIMIVGAVTGGVGLGAVTVGALTLVVTAGVISPKLRLLEWYTPEDVRRRIDAYNQELVDDDLAVAPPRRRGSLDLGLTPSGLGLVARF